MLASDTILELENGGRGKEGSIESSTLGACYSICKSTRIPLKVLRKARDFPVSGDYIDDKGNRPLVR
jgi:hypothetical protein